MVCILLTLSTLIKLQRTLLFVTLDWTKAVFRGENFHYCKMPGIAVMVCILLNISTLISYSGLFYSLLWIELKQSLEVKIVTSCDGLYTFNHFNTKLQRTLLFIALDWTKAVFRGEHFHYCKMPGIFAESLFGSFVL